jgi:hypothetical protein
VLDTRVTPELAAEGTARDVVRIVGQARRDAGLDVSDRIRLVIGADGTVGGAVRAHAGFVAAETLAVSLDVRPASEVEGEPQPAGGGLVTVVVARAEGPVIMPVITSGLRTATGLSRPGQPDVRTGSGQCPRPPGGRSPDLVVIDRC